MFYVLGFLVAIFSSFVLLLGLSGRVTVVITLEMFLPRVLADRHLIAEQALKPDFLFLQQLQAVLYRSNLAVGAIRIKN